MLRTTDIVLVIVMTAAATVTYSIKHRAELKLEEVRKLEADIRLERDTIDLLKADWALLTQPNRLQRLIDAYNGELQLIPTASTQLAQPMELPMLKADVPPPEPEKDGKDKKGKSTITPVPVAENDAKPAADDGVAALIGANGDATAPGKAPATAEAEDETDSISTGSVAQ